MLMWGAIAVVAALALGWEDLYLGLIRAPGATALGAYLKAWYVQSPLTEAAVCYMIWPWITVATLLLYRISMRKRAIQFAQVLRVVLYSCDAGWVVIAATAILINVGIKPSILDAPERMSWVLISLIVMAIWTSYRLGAAYDRYLRFDHADVTVILSQIIVVQVIVLGMFLTLSIY